MITLNLLAPELLAAVRARRDSRAYYRRLKADPERYRAHLEQIRAWQVANPEAYARYKRKWNEANRDYHARWYAEHPGYNRDYYAKNREKLNAYKREWYARRKAEAASKV